jgi:hypothetical protein
LPFVSEGTMKTESTMNWLRESALRLRTGSSFRVWLITVSVVSITSANEPTRLSWRPSQTGLEVSWPGVIKANDGSTVRPYFELQQSFDLRLWKPVGERQHARADTLASTLGLSLSLGQPNAFYRLLSVEAPETASLGIGGAEVFGYEDAFANALQRIGQISPDQFAATFPTTAQYLDRVSWDPTGAQFWDRFDANPDVVNRGKNGDAPGFRTFDTRLNPQELALLKTNGFVVTARLGGSSFGEVFYNLWHNDLPVFISCDAILQAWHRTYDAMLEEIEETYLFNSVQTMLDAMAAQLPAASSVVGNGALRDSLLDADYFLAVARSLLAGTNNPPVPSLLSQDARVAGTLSNIEAQQLQPVNDFMGFCRVVDFSQFKVRGHYTHTERLGRYFQCLMWLGRIDVPVAGGPFERCPEVVRMASPRELGLAITLWHLLKSADQFDLWGNTERIIESFVGVTDSLTFGQMNGLMAGAGIQSLADISDLARLEALQQDLAHGQLGVQNIRSDWFAQPFGGGERYALPQSFTVLGQKFVPDSWAFSQTEYSSILWVENGATNKVERRVPGALDVAFSVLGNDQIVPELVAQMKGTFQDPDRAHALKFRDDLPYQHNLAAVRAVIDQQSPDVWDSNLYMSWLACLRELSAPTTDAGFPESMRTRAWAMKTLNTQLASWTQLRHDTILYAKQSYANSDACVYPAGFVEPRLEFWQRLESMTTRAADLIAGLNYSGSYSLLTNVPARFDPATGKIINPGGPQTNLIGLAVIQERQVSHLQSFGSVVDRLGTLVVKELTHDCFSSDDAVFLDGLMEQRQRLGCGGPNKYSGWFPQLFYRTIYWQDDTQFHGTYGAGAYDALVADVNTDAPDPIVRDPGSVLHEAVGRVNLLLCAVDSGSDRFVCAGPVLSHYEFEVLGAPRRISDQEWGGPIADVDGPFVQIIDGVFPPDVPAGGIEGLQSPVWTRDYLVPAR